MLLDVDKRKCPTSRADRLATAASEFNSAKDTVGELRDELQSWRDNLPKNLQVGTKAEELDEAINSLDELASSLDSTDPDFDFDIDMPGMF